MAQLTDLPYELVAAILRRLDIDSLSSSLLVCKHVFNTVVADPAIPGDILKRLVPASLFPLGIATLRAYRLAKPRDIDLDSVKELLNLLENEPAKLVLEETKSMRLSDALRLAKLHDIVDHFTNDFMNEAWSLLGQSDLVLSPLEYFRVCRSFYHVELLCGVSRKHYKDLDAGYERSFFLETLSPWIVEQMGCAHDYLEKRMSKAIFSVLSQDIEFGEVSVDYISCGGGNTWKQGWLSQGLSFVHSLIHADSDDSKFDMLHSALGNDDAALYQALTMKGDGEVDLGGEIPLEQYTEEQLKELSSPVDRDDDNDMGPFRAWFAAHADLPKPHWTMLEHNAGRRELAYVLWDWERIESHDLLLAFDNAPYEPEHWSGDLEAMLESFEERSQIWRKGGRGYWKKGDLSGIEWPKSYYRSLGDR